ncbi:unnamed protein product [Cylindrotheca closterium]|uniref:Uncharacterized protein n=1 Tax=Cylindrotheca closterium TaxID=2856 RepID=A0AAD2JHH6_9STRA|nr:unnamed protein product [Cylindrotheca closterium]
MATTPQRDNKRTRFDNSASDQSSAPPLASFKDVVQNHCASLQPALRDILINSATIQFLPHMDTANKKERAVTRMESEAAYVPRSVKLHCKLHCTKLTTQDAEYANLEATLSNSARTFEQAAKATIVQATKLDVKVHRTAAKRVFCEALYKASKAYITLNDLDLQQIHKYANTIMDRHHEEITPIFELPDFITKEHLKANYTQFTSATEPLPNPFLPPDILPRANNNNLPLGNQAVVAPAANLNPYHNAAAAAQNQNVNRHIEDTLAHIWRSIRTCFLDAWTAYLRQQKDNDNALRMKKMSTELLTNEATAATAMQIDQEAALPPATLATLIQREVLKATAPLKGTIRGLETQLKNSQRGLPGASLKPQRPGKGGRGRGGGGRGRGRGNPNAGRAPRQDGPQAAESANASNRDSQGTNTNASRDRSNNKRSNSSNAGNKRKHRSGRKRN